MPKIRKKVKFIFKDDWMKMPEFSKWVVKEEGKSEKGHDLISCSVCGKKGLLARKASLLKHLTNSKHKYSLAMLYLTQSEGDYKVPSLMDSIRLAELKLTAFIASYNLSFSVLDSLVPLLCNIVPDSEVVSNLTLNSTEAKLLVENNFGGMFQFDEDESENSN